VDTVIGGFHGETKHVVEGRADSLFHLSHAISTF